MLATIVINTALCTTRRESSSRKLQELGTGTHVVAICPYDSVLYFQNRNTYRRGGGIVKATQ